MTSNDDSDDASANSSSSDRYDPVDLNSETLGYMKSNDEDFNAFYVTFNGDANPNFPFDPLSIDWEEEGNAFSKSRHVKVLEIRDLRQDSDEHYFYCIENQEERIRNAKAFYRAVAANRSCKYLSIEGNITYGLEMKDTVSILRPFIQNNDKLCYLTLGHFALDARTTQILASALSQCAGSLRSFGLTRIENLTGRAMEKIINALKVTSCIEHFSFDENDINDDAAAVLGDALTTLCLKSLSVAGDFITMEYGSISPAGMEAITDGLMQNSTLEKLSFNRFPIGFEGGLFLAEAVSNNSSLVLKELDIFCAVHSGNFAPSLEGWELFFDFLSNSSLHKLQLGGNNIPDDAIPSMVDCLNSMSSLTELNLSHCSNITDSGWTNFFRLLRNNTTLRKCGYLNNLRGTDVIEAMWKTLCDRTSVDSIFSSNHTLCDIRSWSIDPGIKSILNINKNDDKVEVARQKIIKYYFLVDNNLHELGIMDLGLLPRVLEHVDKYEPARLYEIVRFIPSLVHSIEKTNDARRKRKRMA